MRFVAEIVDDHVAQFAADFALAADGGRSIDQRSHAKRAALAQGKGRANATPFHDFGVGPDDDVSAFGVERSIAQHRTRCNMNALHGAMYNHPNPRPSLALVFLQGAQAPSQLEATQVALKPFRCALKQVRYLLQHVGIRASFEGRRFLPALRHPLALVRPVLAILQAQHHLHIGGCGKQTGMNARVGFGLQAFLPLICNGPHAKVKGVLLAKHVQGIEVRRGRNFQHEGISHVTKL